MNDNNQNKEDNKFKDSNQNIKDTLQGCGIMIVALLVAFGIPILLLSGISEGASCLLESTDNGFLKTVIIIVALAATIFIISIFGRHRRIK